jgi:hypothetical protein
MSKVEKFWENATADDFARVMEGETVEARFWDDNLQGWATRTLSGWQTTGVRPLWHSSDGFVWTRCQVYREPSWYTNKPDPGLGCRLLGKFPDEPLAVGDEFFKGGEWHPSCLEIGDPQSHGLWYRRRIEPVEPEPKHYVLRVGDSCETPNGNRIKVISQDGTQSFVNFGVGDKVKTIHGQTITITEKGFEVTQ